MMIEPTTYPEMNAQIVSILRTGNEASQYAAARIEQLEAEVKALRRVCDAAAIVVRQTTANAAYRRHDRLIEALEVVDLLPCSK